MSSVSSRRSNLPPSRAEPSNASTAFAVACSFKLSGSILWLLPPGASGLRPIQNPLFPDVEESGKNQDHENQHLYKTEQIVIVVQVAVNHYPGIQKNGFDIEQYKQHPHQIKFHAEALACVAR